MAVLISNCIVVNAQQLECDLDDDKSCSQPLEAGDVAPFSGQLLTPSLAVKLGQRSYSFDARLKMETDFIEKSFQLDLEFEKKLRKIDNKSYANQVALLTDRLEKAKMEKWYQQPMFIATVSVFLTGAIFVGSAYAYSSFSK